MSQIRLAGAKNAAMDGTVFNDLQIAQSFMPTAAGIDTIGVHLQLGMNMNDDARAGWKDYVDGVYASLVRFTNNRPEFSSEQLAYYLNTTFWADVALAEARRDILMFNFEDATAVSAKKDYFGPGFQENMGSDRMTQIVKFNSLAASYAAKFAHPTFPVKDIFTYLVGNVFTDDTSARMNYIYFHCHNRSLHSTNPEPFQALAAFESIIKTYEESENVVNSVTKSMIHALILKVYGDASLMKAPILNIGDHLKFQYDKQLLNALRNAYYVPEFQPSQIVDAQGKIGTVTEGEWYTAQDNAAKLVTGGIVAYQKGPMLVYQLKQTFSSSRHFDVDELNNALRAQVRLYTGKVFKGEELCASLLFSQEVVVTQEGPDGAQYHTAAAAQTHSGITIAHMWCNAMSQIENNVWNQYWIRPHMLTIMAQDNQLNYSIPPTMAAALRAFSQCNTFRAQVSFSGGVVNPETNQIVVYGIKGFTLCDPIDEFATYTHVRMYTTPFAKAYFTAGVDVYSPMNNLQTTDGSKPQTNSKKNYGTKSKDKGNADNSKPNGKEGSGK